MGRAKQLSTKKSGPLRNALTAIWGSVTGVAPHVLHHVGPLAGAAFLAGVGGQVLFFVIGLGMAVPMLRRLYRRFGSWVAPAVAVAVFALTYTISSVVVGPLITGSTAATDDNPPVTSTTDEHGH